MRILIVKRDKVGDMLLTTPLLKHLKRSLPGSEVHVLSSDYNGWVVSDCPEVARLQTYPRLRAASLVKPMELARCASVFLAARRERYDVAIAAGGEYQRRAIERAIAVRAKRTVAYAPADHPFGAGLTDPLPPPKSGHEMDRILALAAPLGILPPEHPLWPEFVLPARAKSFADAWLAERGLRSGRYVVLGLGARRCERQPSTEQILRWSTRWRDESGLETVFMWTPGRGAGSLYPGDDEVAGPVLEALERGRCDIHPFRGPILEALGLVWQAATSLFPDSGLMHFAAASPGGVLGFFAGPDLGPAPDQWAPRGPRARWLRAEARLADMPEEFVFGELDRLLGPSAR